jgi:hypothetical protein
VARGVGERHRHLHDLDGDVGEPRVDRQRPEGGGIGEPERTARADRRPERQTGGDDRHPHRDEPRVVLRTRPHRRGQASARGQDAAHLRHAPLRRVDEHQAHAADDRVEPGHHAAEVGAVRHLRPRPPDVGQRIAGGGHHLRGHVRGHHLTAVPHEAGELERQLPGTGAELEHAIAGVQVGGGEQRARHRELPLLDVPVVLHPTLGHPVPGLGGRPDRSRGSHVDLQVSATVSL